jgi:hypothetical protein
MRRIICTLLCLVICVFAFASCGEEEIGGYLPEYDDVRPQEVEVVTLNFYIVCDDTTTDNAKSTIELRLSQYAEEKFKTKLNVFYVNESEYDATIADKTKSGVPDRADIVLVNSAKMMNSLMEDELICDLTALFSNKAYGKLNVSINSAILESSKIDGKYYCVPNNRLVRDYEVVVISREVAEYLYIAYKIGEYNTAESVEPLIEALRQDGKDDDYINEHIKVTTAKNSDIQNYLANDYYCNIAKYPTVTADDAFASAFAVVKSDVAASRSMDVIYALSFDAEFRNLLQYGVEGTNFVYDEDGNVVRVSEGVNVYHMNLDYTGDRFLADYCPEISWTKEVMENGKKQNNDAVVFVPPVEEEE